MDVFSLQDDFHVRASAGFVFLEQVPHAIFFFSFLSEFEGGGGGLQGETFYRRNLNLDTRHNLNIMMRYQTSYQNYKTVQRE